MNDSSRRGWLKSIGVSVGILALITTLCMGISLLSTARIRTTEPYRHAVDLALKSPEVRAALGEPVTVGWLPAGNVSAVEGDEVQLNIPLRGPAARAAIRVNGTKRDGGRTYWAIRVDTERGDHIDLLDP